MNSLVTLDDIEFELQQRLKYPYNWFQKQNNNWDQASHFIYTCKTFSSLLSTIEKSPYNDDDNLFFNYTLNRWYNFWSAQAVEAIFKSCDGVKAEIHKRNKYVDFYLKGVPLDHKTTVYPYKYSFPFATTNANKRKLIAWLYRNQSSQSRYHLKNRLFIVVYHRSGEHWKLKADLKLLKKVIVKYVDDFSPKQLHSFIFTSNSKTLSDIIWVSK